MMWSIISAVSRLDWLRGPVRFNVAKIGSKPEF